MIKDSEVQQLTPEDFSRTTVSFKKKQAGAGEGVEEKGKKNMANFKT